MEVEGASEGGESHRTYLELLQQLNPAGVFLPPPQSLR